MKELLTAACILSFVVFGGCDLRNETAKRGVEKYESSPTPPLLPAPTPTPIDPALVVKVDTTQEGDTIFVNGFKEPGSANCTKFNRVLVNGDDNTVTIKGVCRQVMINGDRNKLTVNAAAEFVVNGTENEIKYSRIANDKWPLITEGRPGNVIEMAATKTK